VSVYHLLIENKVVGESTTCSISALVRGDGAVHRLVDGRPAGLRCRPARVRGDPATRARARPAERAGDDGAVRRPTVSRLPGLRDGGHAEHRPEARSHREAEDRDQADRVHRPGLAAGALRGDRGRLTEPDVQLHAGDLRQPGRREHRLARQRVHREGGRERAGNGRQAAARRAGVPPRHRRRKDGRRGREGRQGLGDADASDRQDGLEVAKVPSKLAFDQARLVAAIRRLGA